MAEPTGQMAHATWAAARALGRWESLPEPVTVDIRGLDVAEAFFQLTSAASVAAWADAMRKRVTIAAFAQHVDVFVWFHEGTVTVKAWAHMTHNDAATFLAALGMDLTETRRVEPQALLAWMRVTS